jgi:hypothetical protein
MRVVYLDPPPERKRIDVRVQRRLWRVSEP